MMFVVVPAVDLRDRERPPGRWRRCAGSRSTGARGRSRPRSGSGRGRGAASRRGRRRPRTVIVNGAAAGEHRPRPEVDRAGREAGRDVDRERGRDRPEAVARGTSSRPSSSMTRAPAEPSSPGWNISSTRPASAGPTLHEQPRRAEQHRDVGVVAARVHRARRPPTRSRARCPRSTGSASMSARSRTVGPGRAAVDDRRHGAEPATEPRRQAQPLQLLDDHAPGSRAGRSPISGRRWSRRRIATTSVLDRLGGRDVDRRHRCSSLGRRQRARCRRGSGRARTRTRRRRRSPTAIEVALRRLRGAGTASAHGPQASARPSPPSPRPSAERQASPPGARTRRRSCRAGCRRASPSRLEKPAPKQDAEHRVVVARAFAGPGCDARLHQPDRPRVATQHLADRDRPAAHRVLPVACRSAGSSISAKTQVDEPVEQVLLVADVPVERHRLRPDLLADALHRQRLEPALVGDASAASQHLLAAQPGRTAGRRLATPPSSAPPCLTSLDLGHVSVRHTLTS